MARLGLAHPVLAAPMAGGASTTALVVAAGESGSLGFLAGGYQTPEQLAAQINETRKVIANFGVNLFAPNPLAVDPGAFERYAKAIQIEADRFGIDLADLAPRNDDDWWREKIDLLLDDPVPLVSFTFAIPDTGVISALQHQGSLVAQSVTSPDEAREAEVAGANLLIVQGYAAGGHSATTTPRRPVLPLTLEELVRSVRQAVALPIVAAGGLASASQVGCALGAGADAVMVGTMLLRTNESGASATYKAALAKRREQRTVLTRAFSGRPARALPNRFTERYDALAPLGYPAIHHLTSPLRRAAARAGDDERLNIWAGEGHALAIEEPAADTLIRLAGPC